MKIKEQKIQLLHPTGKRAPCINSDTYYLFEKAMMETLKNIKGLSFSEIAEGVKKYFINHKINFTGSVDWFSISVKNHLEATGLVESFSEKGKKLNRLKKVERGIKSK